MQNCFNFNMLYLSTYWELEGKQSIWEYLLDPFCRLPASEVVYGTDRSTDTKKYDPNTINGPAVPFFVSTHGISSINVSTLSLSRIAAKLRTLSSCQMIHVCLKHN